MPTHCAALPLLLEDIAERISIEHVAAPKGNELGLLFFNNIGGLLIQYNLTTVRDCFACPRM